MVRDGPPEPPPYPSEKARGGEIVLRTRLRRVVFVGGLAAVVVIVLLLSFWRGGARTAFGVTTAIIRTAVASGSRARFVLCLT